MKVKSKCPQCGEIAVKEWKTSPILMQCKKKHTWHPRQDVLAAVYVHKAMTEKEYLND